MEKKVKLQLFDPEGRVVEEKWVNQDSEFYKGPKSKHDGPMRIEFTFMDQGDLDKVLKYIQQLTGMLPLTEAKARKEASEPDTPQFREQLIAEAIQLTDQDQLIKFLREHGFVFLTWEHLQTFEDINEITIKTAHAENYEWMIKRLKTAKNPLADKYDLMLLFGIKLMRERSEKVVIYLNGEFHKSLNISLPDKPRETVKKTDMMKFPAAMIQEERDKFRYELRQLQLNPEKEVTKFFKRWRSFVENVPAIPQDTK